MNHVVVVQSVEDLTEGLALEAIHVFFVGIERVFTAGGGAPATIGRTAAGELMLPAISLHCLVPGLRVHSPKAREQEIDFLVGGFHDVVYI